MPRLNCFLFGTDWPAIAPDVVRTLLGPPNPDASSRKELRWGKRGSFALTLDSGRWRDYESGRSGGVLDLVERETGADRAFREQAAAPDVTVLHCRIPSELHRRLRHLVVDEDSNVTAKVIEMIRRVLRGEAVRQDYMVIRCIGYQVQWGNGAMVVW